MISWHRLSCSSSFVWTFWAFKRWLGRFAMLAFVSTWRQRHLAAAAAKHSPPKFRSKTCRDTIFDIFDIVLQFLRFFFDIFDTFCSLSFIEIAQKIYLAQNIVRIVRFPFCPPLNEREWDSSKKRNVYLSRIPIYKAALYFSEYSDKWVRKFLITFESKTEGRNIFRRKNPHFSSSA